MSCPVPAKRQFTRRDLVALFVCAGAATRVHGQAPPAGIDLVSDEWHDLTRKDGSGLYFDLIRMVYGKRGVAVRIKMFPYARTVQMVKEKKADAWVASFLKEKDFPLYPKWHFDQNEQLVVYRKGPEAGFADTASLRNRRVAWLRDFGLDRYIGEPMKITEVDTLRSGFQMLDRKRIDYLIGAKSDLMDEIRKYKVDMSKYEMKFAINLGLFLAFADTARAKALKEMWDQEMETLHKSDAFKAVYKKYGYSYPYP